MRDFFMFRIIRVYSFLFEIYVQSRYLILILETIHVINTRKRSDK